MHTIKYFASDSCRASHSLRIQPKWIISDGRSSRWVGSYKLAPMEVKISMHCSKNDRLIDAAQLGKKQIKTGPYSSSQSNTPQHRQPSRNSPERRSRPSISP